MTGKLTEGVSTAQIYWGAVPFVVIQVIMVTLVIIFPALVTAGLDKASGVDPTKIQIQTAPPPSDDDEAPAAPVIR